eukprot:XP_780326.2 PREDICTED: uncharacterized protein LOC574837 [Strongylocentrotus purpuratus]
MAKVNFEGKWKHTKDEKFDDLLKALGVNILKRKAITSLSPQQEITQNGDHFVVTNKTSIKTETLEFTVGQEFKFKNPLSGKDEMLMTEWDGDKIVITNKADPNGVVATRELINANHMTITQRKGDVTAVRHFNKWKSQMASSGKLPDMSGYWKLKKNDENFEKYLQANGINFVLRKVIKSATMYQDIEQDGNQFKIKIILPVGQQEMEFTVGEAFETYNSFRKVTLHRIATWDGQAMVLKSANSGDNEPEEKRELVDGALCITMTKGDVSTKRIFEKAEKK